MYINPTQRENKKKKKKKKTYRFEIYNRLRSWRADATKKFRNEKSVKIRFLRLDSSETEMTQFSDQHLLQLFTEP